MIELLASERRASLHHDVNGVAMQHHANLE
jgi:hypothetical protein